MRLNRSNAQFRDRDRAGSTSTGNVQDMACEYVWKELIGTAFICQIPWRLFDKRWR